MESGRRRAEGGVVRGWRASCRRRVVVRGKEGATRRFQECEGVCRN